MKSRSIELSRLIGVYLHLREDEGHDNWLAPSKSYDVLKFIWLCSEP